MGPASCRESQFVREDVCEEMCSAAACGERIFCDSVPHDLSWFLTRADSPRLSCLEGFKGGHGDGPRQVGSSRFEKVRVWSCFAFGVVGPTHSSSTTVADIVDFALDLCYTQEKVRLRIGKLQGRSPHGLSEQGHRASSRAISFPTSRRASIWRFPVCLQTKTRSPRCSCRVRHHMDQHVE